MKIHLIRGFTRHGKSTFAKKLSQELKNIKIYSFATALKQEVCNLLQLNYNDIDKDQALPSTHQKDGCVTFRDWCKKIALERKAQDKQYFAKLVLNQILEDHETEVIIDDFRFPEELECLQSFGAQIEHYLVYHNEGIIPDDKNISEHSLDHLQFENEILVLR